MAEGDKVLTVSYGAFSCTVVGVDDPLSTMREIADYFQEIGADSPLFNESGGEVDPEVLAKIAKSQNAKEAVLSRNSEPVMLLDAYLAPAEDDEPGEDVESDEEMAEEVAPVILGEAHRAAPAAVEEEADQEGEVDEPFVLHADYGQKPEADVSEENESEDDTEAAPPSLTDDEDAQGDEAEVADESVAEKLRRIRSVVAESGLMSRASENRRKAMLAERGITEEEYEQELAEQAAAEAAKAAEEAAKNPPVAKKEEPKAEGADEAEDDGIDADAVMAEVSSILAGDDENDAEENSAFDQALSDVIDEMESDEDEAEDETAEASADEEEEEWRAEADPEEDDVPDAEVSADDHSDAPDDNTDEAIRQAMEDGSKGETDDADDSSGTAKAMADTPSSNAGGSSNTMGGSTVDAMAGSGAVAGKGGGPGGETMQVNQERRHGGLENAPVENVTRIFDEADLQLGRPDSNERRKIIQHLRGAVAVTRADEYHADDGWGGAARDRYRSDLAEVMTPRIQPVVGQVTVAELPLDPVTTKRNRKLAKPHMPEVQNGFAEDNAEFSTPKLARTPDAEFAKFLSNTGVETLPQKMEAAAAYLSDVELRPDFTRPMLMGKLKDSQADAISREEELRAFGQLVRQGKLARTPDGRFTVTDSTKYRS